MSGQIAIQGIRITNVTVTRGTDGQEKVEGDYELVSTADRVLAKQGFGGYSEIKVEMAGETRQALVTFLSGLKKDTMTMLGLQE